MKNSTKSTELSKLEEQLMDFVLDRCERSNTFKMALLETLTDDCPFEEACGEQYIESHGEDYYDGRNDLD